MYAAKIVQNCVCGGHTEGHTFAENPSLLSGHYPDTPYVGSMFSESLENSAAMPLSGHPGLIGICL